jgi:hypothetical protein
MTVTVSINTRDVNTLGGLLSQQPTTPKTLAPTAVVVTDALKKAAVIEANTKTNAAIKKAAEKTRKLFDAIPCGLLEPAKENLPAQPETSAATIAPIEEKDETKKLSVLYGNISNFNTLRINLLRILKDPMFISTTVKTFNQLIAPLGWMFYVCQFILDSVVIHKKSAEEFRTAENKTLKEKLSLYNTTSINLLREDDRISRMTSSAVWGASAITSLLVGGIVANLIVVAAYLYSVSSSTYTLEKTKKELKKGTTQQPSKEDALKIKELKINLGLLSIIAVTTSVALFTCIAMHLVALTITSLIAPYSLHRAFSNRNKKQKAEAEEIKSEKPVVLTASAKPTKTFTRPNRFFFSLPPATRTKKTIVPDNQPHQTPTLAPA